jgi:hypothetical protein
MTAALVLSCFVPVTGASGQINRLSEAQVREQLAEIDHEASVVEGQSNTERAGFLPSYDCPPNLPNKHASEDALTALQGRSSALHVHLNQLANQAQFRRGRLTEGNKDDLETAYNRTAAHLSKVSKAINEARQDLASRPKSARDCNPTLDPITSLSYAPPSMEPGQNVTANVTALTASGKAVNITSVFVDVSNVGTFINTVGLGGTNPAVTFKISDVRRQGPFQLSVDVAGFPAGFPAGSPTTTMKIIVPYEVKNVAPEIVSSPADPSANPGEDLVYSGTVEVIDRNADFQNPNEIMSNQLNLTGHPMDLVTAPGEAFKRLSKVTLASLDPSKGKYVFNVERIATVHKPHKHGIFSTTIRVIDRKGSATEKDVSLTVKNVPPVGHMEVRPGQFFHSDDGIPVELVGTVSDDNGRDDIEDIEIDATDAAGGKQVFRKSDGSIQVAAAGDDGWSFKLNQKSFRHTPNEGRHTIGAAVRDGGAPEQGQPNPERGNFPGWISVGNEPPDATAYGIIHDAALTHNVHLCPGQWFRAGMNATDKNRDKLKVTATFNPPGTDPWDMTIEPGDSTYTVDMIAPDKPGTYTLTFEAAETDTVKKKSVIKTIELIVDPCSQGQPDKKVTLLQSGAGVPVDIAAATGSMVKITTADPPLPGDVKTQDLATAKVLGDNWTLALRLDYDAKKWQPGADTALDKSAANNFLSGWAQWSASATYLSGGIKTGIDWSTWCDFGTGLGPKFAFNDTGLTYSAPPEKAVEAADDIDWDDWEDDEDDYDPSPLHEINRDLMRRWLNGEFGPPVEIPARIPAASSGASSGETNGDATPKTEKERLQAEADELKAKQEIYDKARQDLERQRKEALDAGDTANVTRLDKLIKDVTEAQDAIHAQTTVIDLQLNDLDNPELIALQAERDAITAEIDAAARKAIEEQIAWNEALQGAKENVTWVTRWVSSGSKLQYDTARTTRLADLELAAAEAKLAMVNTLLEAAEPGSNREKILKDKQTVLEGQRKGAQEMLSSNLKLTAAGYTIDVVLIFSGARLAQLGKTAVTAAATRVFAADTAEAVIANTTQKGLIQLGKDAFGVGGAQAAERGVAQAGAATGAPASGVLESGAGKAASQEAQGAATNAADSSSSSAITGELTGSRLENAVKFEQALADARTSAADVIEKFNQLLNQAAQEAGITDFYVTNELGRRVVNPKWVGLWLDFAEQHIDEIVGGADDVIKGPLTEEVQRLLQGLEQAGARGRAAFQANKTAEALKRAQEILERQLGTEGAAKRLAEGQAAANAGRAALEAEDQALDDMLSGSDFFSLGGVGTLFFLAHQRDLGYGDDPVQGMAGADGHVRLALPFGDIKWGKLSVDLQYAKPQDGFVVKNVDPWTVPGFGGLAGNPFMLGGDMYWPILTSNDQSAAISKGLTGSGATFVADPCVMKKFAPFKDWDKPVPGAPVPRPVGAAELTLP